jgi:hypothetical protein
LLTLYLTAAIFLNSLFIKNTGVYSILRNRQKNSRYPMGSNIDYFLFLFFNIFVCVCFSCPPWHPGYSLSKKDNSTCYKIYTYQASHFDAKRKCEADNGLITRNKELCSMLSIMPMASYDEADFFIG